MITIVKFISAIYIFRYFFSFYKSENIFYLAKIINYNYVIII